MHHRSRSLKTMFMCGGLAAAVGLSACGRSGEEPKSVSEAQTQTAQPANQPVTVAGCLKAGEAAGTFVLTTAQAEGSRETATYQLTRASGVDLQEHIGKRIEVSGTVQAQQEIASRTSAVAPNERPTGTSGTPRVETKTEIDVKQLSVGSVKPLGDRCDM